MFTRHCERSDLSAEALAKAEVAALAMMLRQPCPQLNGFAKLNRKTEKAPASAPQRLQALEGQPLGIADAGQIELADEGRGRLAVAIGQRHDGINGNSLCVHGLPRAVRGHKPRSV